MMPLRVCVVGAGHLGKIHARLLSGLDDVQVVAVTDPSDAARNAVRETLGIPTYASYRQIMDSIDAAIIAAPSGLHAAVATDLLEDGKHVFVEKPLTTGSEDARRLVTLANRKGCVLQVGHVERFNPAWTASEDVCRAAKYIEATRASSFPGRCLDVGVVMDLMIHDLELVLSVTNAELLDIQASGLAVASEHEDLAEARLTFGCGLVANLKASRVSLSATRTMQVFGENGFAELDFGKPSATLVRPSSAILERSIDLMNCGDPKVFREKLFAEHLAVEASELPPRNAILDELHDFVISIRTGTAPTVSGEAGARAVVVANQILDVIDRRAWNGCGALGARGDLSVRGPKATPRVQVRRAA